MRMFYRIVGLFSGCIIIEMLTGLGGYFLWSKLSLQLPTAQIISLILAVVCNFLWCVIWSQAMDIVDFILSSKDEQSDSGEEEK